jgi:hypothetical protein
MCGRRRCRRRRYGRVGDDRAGHGAVDLARARGPSAPSPRRFFTRSRKAALAASGQRLAAPRSRQRRYNRPRHPVTSVGRIVVVHSRMCDEERSCEFGGRRREGGPSRWQRRAFRRLWRDGAAFAPVTCWPCGHPRFVNRPRVHIGRAPRARWTFWQDQQDAQSCPRYFSATLSESRRVDIELNWPADSTLRVVVPEVDLVWTANLAATAVTRVLNAVGRAMPDRPWRARPVLTAMGPSSRIVRRSEPMGAATDC